MKTVKLVYASGSNCSQRALWALRYKNVPHEVLLKDTLSKEQLLKVSPLGKIPAVIVGETPLAESMAICEWLEETIALPALLPKDPFARAKVREVCEIVNGTIHPVQSASVARFFVPALKDEEIVAVRKKWIEQMLPPLKQVCFRDSRYSVGKQFTLADIFVIPIYAKLIGFGASPKDYPPFDALVKECQKHDAIWNACPDELRKTLE